MAAKVTKGKICDGTISKIISQGAQFVWKVSFLYHKVHYFWSMPLYYRAKENRVFWNITHVQSLLLDNCMQIAQNFTHHFDVFKKESVAISKKLTMMSML